LQSQLRQSLKEGLAAYERRMAEAQAGPPLGEDGLHDLHKAARAAAMEAFDAARVGEDDPEVQESRSELTRRVKLLYEKARAGFLVSAKHEPRLDRAIVSLNSLK
jgi:hypothetical protein